MKYPLSIRVLHWAMATVILGMIWAGWTMVSLDDKVPAKFDTFYPWHKSFGMLILLLAMIRLAKRLRSKIPPLPSTLAPWELRSAHIAHLAFYALMIAVPCMGYSMSSSYTQSDGVFFFGINLPELLPKNDDRFEVFRLLHRVLAYSLFGLIVIHIGAVLKHRLFDRNKANDVLPRMV